MKLRWLAIWIIVGLGCSTETTKQTEDEAGGDTATEWTVEESNEAPGDSSGALREGESSDTVAVQDADLSTDELEEAVVRFKVGDVAPDIQISQWVAGEPLAGLEEGQLYVVEFWATWCGPCLRSMPHVSELQEKYHDEITIIGVTNEDVDTVTEFLDQPSRQDSDQSWSEIVKYRLAIDEDKSTRNAYLRASGAQGIPTAYIVGRKGRLLWTGHPMRIDGPLEDIVAGDWNDENAIVKSEEYQATIESLREQLMQALMAQRGQNWDEALAIIAAVEKDEQLSGLAGDLSRMRLDLFMAAKRTDQALALVRELQENAWSDPGQLNEFAWKLVSELPDEVSALELSMKLVNRAMELTNDEEPPILDTLARVHYEQGDLDSAIEWQRKAVDLLDEATRDRESNYQETLDKYLIERATLNDEGESDSSEDSEQDEESSDEVTAAT